MRILFFIESLRSGGKERRLVELIKGLSKNTNISMEIVLIKNDIHYEDIYSTDIKIHFTERKNIKKDPRVFFKFYKIAQKFEPDIIHVWGDMVAIYSIPTKLLLKVPLINNQITDAPIRVSNSLLGHKLAFPFSDIIISNSKAGLKSYNAPQEKSKIIYNGFDIDRISNLMSNELLRKKFNITTKFVVGMVASFSDKKDYKTYIYAANLVLFERRDVTFLCVGAGDYIEYKKLIKPKNENRILFISKQKKVESLMNVCDIGVLMSNSRVHGEGISNALLEFMSLEKPVIANKAGGNSELIENNKNGFLINDEDFKMLKNKILLIINNLSLRKEFGKRSRQIVLNKFNIEQMISLFEDTYEKIINENCNR